MIRAHGDAVEASFLCLPGSPDLRDLYRRGSGMTLRRVMRHIEALRHYDVPLWSALETEAELAKKPKADEIREAQKRWQARNEARRQAEEAS